MMNVEIDDETARVLNQLATEQHLSPAQLVKTALRQYLKDCRAKQDEAHIQPPTNFQDFFGTLKDSPHFKDDPVEIQRRMRDEWER